MSKDRRGKSGATEEGPGFRSGRNTTFAHPVYEDGPPVAERGPSASQTRAVSVKAFDEADEFHQHTALFDKGRFLGELADLVDGSPDTRAKVEAEPEPPKGFRLITVAGPEIGQVYVFKGEQVVIGRDATCELPLTDIAVSRNHARIVRDGIRFRLQDMESNNGTYLNGEVVSDAVLAPGDELMIGERTFRFVELNETPPTNAEQRALEDGQAVAEDPAESEASARAQSSGVRGVSAAPAEPERGRALRKVLVGGGMLISLAVLVGGGLWSWGAAQRAAAARVEQARIRTWVLQGIELTKTRRFGDARTVLAQVLELRPEHERARRYMDHSKWELSMWDQLQQGRQAAIAGRYDEALQALAAVDAKSAYAPDARRAARRVRRARAQAWLDEARSAMQQGRFDTAETLVKMAEAKEPGISGTLLDQIESRRPVPVPPRPVSRKIQVPAGLERVVALYRQGQMAAALDAAAALGTAEAQAWSERAKALRGRLEALRGAHQAKDGSELLAQAPELLRLDTEVGYLQGEIRDELERMLADGHYLRGVDQQLAGKTQAAFESFERALQSDRNHALTLRRIQDLEAQAEDVYYQALVAAEDDATEARSLLQKVLQTTRPSSRIHRMAARSLESL